MYFENLTARSLKRTSTKLAYLEEMHFKVLSAFNKPI